MKCPNGHEFNWPYQYFEMAQAGATYTTSFTSTTLAPMPTYIIHAKCPVCGAEIPPGQVPPP